MRFNVTLLGSRAVAGTFDMSCLEREDREGSTMRDAMRDFGLDPSTRSTPLRIAAISCSPTPNCISSRGLCSEDEDLPVGVVTAINGGNRFAVELGGMAGHAGTVPMHLRLRRYARRCCGVRAGRRAHLRRRARSSSAR